MKNTDTVLKPQNKLYNGNIKKKIHALIKLIITSENHKKYDEFVKYLIEILAVITSIEFKDNKGINHILLFPQISEEMIYSENDSVKLKEINLYTIKVT